MIDEYVLVTAPVLVGSGTPFFTALVRTTPSGNVRISTRVSGFVVMAAYGVIGVAVGALVRNQIAAVVGVLVWMTAVEYTVIPAFPAVGRWMPLGATSALFQLGPSMGLDGKLLSASVAGLVLVGYTAAAVVLALLITPKRDVL